MTNGLYPPYHVAEGEVSSLRPSATIIWPTRNRFITSGESVIKNLIRDDRPRMIALAVLLVFLINWKYREQRDRAEWRENCPVSPVGSFHSLSRLLLSAVQVLVVVSWLTCCPPLPPPPEPVPGISILVTGWARPVVGPPASQTQVISTTIHSQPSSTHQHILQINWRDNVLNWTDQRTEQTQWELDPPPAGAQYEEEAITTILRAPAKVASDEGEEVL